MADLEPIPYSDAKIRSILQRVKTIAMVGASSNWNRPSYFVMKYLQGKGYRVIPVNPGTAGKEQLGEKIHASLRDIPDKIDMVDIFRASDQVGPIVEDAIAIGAKVVWLQLGVRNDAAAERPSRRPTGGANRSRYRRPISVTGSRPARSMPAPLPIPRRVHGRRRFSRPQLMFSTMSNTPHRCSTCTTSATSTHV